jgi:hypothetical protein
MSAGFKTALADYIDSIITHIGLVDAGGTELTGGTYARIAAGFAAASNGAMALSADLTFNVPAGVTVGGWRGFSASTAGTNYGGADLTNEAFAGAGTYKLLAASTKITLSDPA